MTQHPNSILNPNLGRKIIFDCLETVTEKSEELKKVTAEREAVKVTLNNRNEQLRDAVDRAKKAIAILQPLAVSLPTHKSTTHGATELRNCLGYGSFKVRRLGRY